MVADPADRGAGVVGRAHPVQHRLGAGAIHVSLHVI